MSLCVHFFVILFLFFLGAPLYAMDGISADDIQAMRQNLKPALPILDSAQERHQEQQTATVVNGQFIVNVDQLNEARTTLKKVNTSRVAPISPEAALLLSIKNRGARTNNVERSEDARKALQQREEDRINFEKCAYAKQKIEGWKRNLSTIYYPETVKKIFLKAEEFQQKDQIDRFKLLAQKDEIRHLFERTLYLEDELFYLAYDSTLSLITNTAHVLFSSTKPVGQIFAHLDKQDMARLLNQECIVQECYNLCSKLQKPEFLGAALISRDDLMIHSDLSLFLHDELKEAPPLKKMEKAGEPISCFEFFKTYGKNEFFSDNDLITINGRRSSAAYYLSSLKYVGPTYNCYMDRRSHYFHQDSLNIIQTMMNEVLIKSYQEEHSYDAEEAK